MSIYERRRATEARMNDPKTADNIDVRKELLERVKRGEMTLEEAQAELAKIKRDAKRNGIPTAYS